jgi:hypothetical protein
LAAEAKMAQNHKNRLEKLSIANKPVLPTSQKPLNAAETANFLKKLKEPMIREEILEAIAKEPLRFHQETLLEQLAPYIEHHQKRCCLILENLFLADSQSLIAYLRDLAIMNYPFAAPCLQSLKDKYGQSFQTDFDVAFQEIAYHEKNRIALFPKLMGEK